MYTACIEVFFDRLEKLMDFNIEFDLNGYEWIILITASLGMIYGVSLLISLISLLNNKRNNVQFWIILMSIISMISYVLAHAFFISFFVYYVGKKTPNIVGIYGSFWAFIWNIAQISIYILFYKRLVYAFDNSIYQVSTCFKRFIYVSIMAYILFEIYVLFIAVEYSLYYSDGIGNITTIKYTELSYDIGSCTLNLLITVVILVSFIKKLRNIAQSLANSLEMSCSNDTDILELFSLKTQDSQYSLMNGYGSGASSIDFDTSDHLTKLFNLMAKLVILCGLMIISTQIVMITILVLDFSEYNTLIKNNEYDNQYGYIIYIVYWYYFIRNIDCIIGITCIYLTFNVTHKRYNICCKYIHKCIRNKCTKKIIHASFEKLLK